MAMSADYSFEYIFIETYAPQFIGHNNFFLGSVVGQVSSFVVTRYKVQFHISLS